MGQGCKWLAREGDSIVLKATTEVDLDFHKDRVFVIWRGDSIVLKATTEVDFIKNVFLESGATE